MLKSILLSWSFPALCGIFIFSSQQIFKFEMNIFLILIFAMMIIRDIIFYILGRKREKRLSARETDCTKKENELKEQKHSIDNYIESSATSKFQSIFNRLTSDSLFPRADFEAFLEVFKNALPGTREYKALTEDFSISDPSCAVKIKSKDNVYLTTLNSCTCIDFKRTQKPCKHMYFLALHLGALSSIDVDSIRNEISSLQDELSSRKKEIARYNLFAKFFKTLNSHKGYSSVAGLFAELEKYRGDAYCKVMRFKRNPAIRSAEKVAELSKEKTELTKRYYECKVKLDTILSALPEVEFLLAFSPDKLFDASKKSDLLKQIDLLVREIEKNKSSTTKTK
ncbi:MAG: SWIM zinc finger family protein [Oscillospiraceae bacterium]|nr:SWIM zinc finger family protein [Oscillospiraceae bacterium]